MVAAVHDLLEALSSAGITIEAHGDSLRYRPRSAMTPDLLKAVKNCKDDLLKILKSPSLSAMGPLFSPGAPGAQASPGASEYSVAQPPSKTDVEFARFERVAQPMADGSGWFDPAFGPEMPSGYVVPHPSDRPAGVPPGWSVDGWRTYTLHMADSCEGMYPEKSAEYRRKADEIDRHMNVARETSEPSQGDYDDCRT